MRRRLKPLTEEEKTTLAALEHSYRRRVEELEQQRSEGNIKFQHALILREQIFRLGRQIQQLKQRENIK